MHPNNIMTKSSAFKLFMKRHSDEFPYSHLRMTRRRYHCKWVLFVNDRWNYRDLQSGFALVETKCISKSLINLLIITASCLPLPPDYNDLADVMPTWGRSIDPNWEVKVNNILRRTLFCCGSRITGKKELYKNCIHALMSIKARDHIDKDVFLSEWLISFNSSYPTTHSYRELVELSLDFYANHMEATNEQTPVNAPVPDSSTSAGKIS